ncbi:MAG TPA: hypothetical protein VII75_09470 [Thermoanaerobaculia bacterium]
MTSPFVRILSLFVVVCIVCSSSRAASNPVSSRLHLLAGSGNTTYFLVENSNRDNLLWETDGTSNGTVPVPVLGLFYSGFIAGNSMLVSTYDPSLGFRVWMTDRTAAGTITLRPTSQDRIYAAASSPDGSAAYFFVRKDTTAEIWRTDGTAVGTVKLGEVPNDGNMSAIAATNTSIVFVARQGINSFIWSLDMSGAAPQKIVSGYREQTAAGSGNPALFTLDYFGSIELWKSDGTAAGTSRVRRDFESFAEVAVHLGALQYFPIADSVHGFELWRTDGTAGGTTLVVDLTPGPGDSVFHALGTMDGLLYFLGSAGGDNGLWRSDGTQSGTALVKQMPSAFWMGATAHAVYVSWDDGVHGLEPWRSDGTPAGTTLLRDIRPGLPDSIGTENYNASPRADGRIVFPANDGITGNELWISDGTTEGTYLLKNIAPEPTIPRRRAIRTVGVAACGARPAPRADRCNAASPLITFDSRSTVLTTQKAHPAPETARAR